jgi:hypothetical protein
MGLLSAKQIGRLRSSTENTLMDTGLVCRRTLTRTDSGGVVNSAAALVETTACRLLPDKADPTKAIILVPLTSTAALDDEVHVGVELYRVIAIVSTAPLILLKLQCTRLDG